MNLAATESIPRPAGLLGSLNNAALRSAEYVVVKGQFVAPGLHRARLAAGLSAGLFGGRALMDLATGRHTDHTQVDPRNVPFFLRPVVGSVRYNEFADDAHDRWLRVADRVAPGALGALGVLAASRYHFAGKIATAEATEKIAETIARGGKDLDLSFGKLEQAIAMRHARPFAGWTAMASLQGSASGANLSPTGYGPMLSSLFALRSDRKVGMGRWHPLRWITATKANSPLGLQDMTGELWRHMLFNHRAETSELHEFRNLGEGILRELYKDVSPEIAEKWLSELSRLRDAALKEVAGIDKHWSAKEIEQLGERSLRELERFMIREGVTDMTSRETVLQSLDVGNNGFLSWVAERDPHTRHVVEAMRAAKAEEIHQRHFDYAKEIGRLPEDAERVVSKAISWPRETRNRMTRGKIVAGGALAVGTGAIAYGATHDERGNDGRTDRLALFVNGAPLKTAEWISNSLNFPPGLHRLENALGLSAGLYSGMKLGEALTGWTLGGTQVKAEQIVKPLRLLHGKLHYNPLGISSGDRWMKVAHHALPAIGGFYGTKLGSDFYFNKRRTANERAEFIDDYSRKISFDQSEPWSYLAAGSALSNVGLGVNFLPIGYGMNLGNRFTLGSGRKVVLPGLKEIISNNHSAYPLGPAELLNYAIEYLVHNPDAEPKQIRDMSKAILTAWFGAQPASRVNRLAGDMLEVRREFVAGRGVPPERQVECRKALKARFTHQGLHDELKAIGLDVLDADIADNGLIGDIGNALGARKAVKRDLDEFRRKEHRRREAANDGVPTAANDDRPAGAEAAGFAERIGRAAERKPASATIG